MKHKRAVLYELMRDHRGVGANGVSGGRLGDLHEHRELDEPSPPRATAERTLRLPVGYLLLGVSAILVIALAAYLVGHSKGRTGEEWSTTLAVPASGTEPGTGEAGSQAAPGLPLAGSQSARQPGAGSSTSRTAGPIESNPRTIGENYFVLVQTSRTNAVRVAEFCRRHGLEAYVDRVNNADFRVFVLPGYAAENASSQAVADLERRIEAVKKAWNESVGRNDLGQHIAVKYRG